MSWVKSLASGSEDIFDEDIDDIVLQGKEWKQNMEKRSKVICKQLQRMRLYRLCLIFNHGCGCTITGCSG